MKIVQVLPALNSGGVERGTVEFAREIAAQGHHSIVVSSGGRMVDQLVAEGTEHIEMPVHKKSLSSLLQVRPMRKLLTELKPDIVHVRSRIPAWIVWLAWRKMPPSTRPGLVSTFHGMYSVTPYSAIMGKAERVISISDCVHQYILDNYDVPPENITRIYRGLDPSAFNPRACSEQWRATLLKQYPELEGKRIILMPGRLSRWKGQEAFLQMMAKLIEREPGVHGVVVGAAEANKEHYLDELLQLRDKLGLNDKVTFVGHRSDIQAFYGVADITCHMSSKSEPFGRTVPEALACGCAVAAYNRGGASESLNAGFQQGLVEPDNIAAFASRVSDLLRTKYDIYLPKEFYLESQVQGTLAVYESLLQQKR
ncbi:glycosyltransferase family 4 protein [Ketobacter alkanivorans]|uniref:Glycosyl transferase n=1 Tax=Ketobacter alkanivorans TaxID=1917421 RepID=A0A2K9LM65_9GAMM|nr:glycosyltransferase family 4 protein [Ketobacter alkanivorans]AUM13446.1 glycosyl transferase [Ketobacter alkanivorans]